jgi:phage terminase large subunit-like protein
MVRSNDPASATRSSPPYSLAPYPAHSLRVGTPRYRVVETVQRPSSPLRKLQTDSTTSSKQLRAAANQPLLAPCRWALTALEIQGHHGMGTALIGTGLVHQFEEGSLVV